MALWRSIAAGLRALFHRTEAEEDMAEEVDAYLREAASAHRARGMGAEEAQRAARVELGGVTPVHERLRAVGWDGAVLAVLADIRYAARRLRHEAGFTIVAMGTLALGIGAATAVFSTIYPVLLQPLPYPHADRIAMIWDQGTEGQRLETTFGTYRELRARARVFDGIAVMKPWHPTMTGAEEPERFDGQRVTADYFRVLGVAPALGRGFLPEEDQAGGLRVVILSEGVWQRRFGGDRDIVGRSILLDGDAHTVAGVMPKDFENVPAPAAQIWTPLQYDLSEGRAWGHHLQMIARLHRGVTTAQARHDLGAIADGPVAEFPRAPSALLDRGLMITPLRADVTRNARPVLLAILGAVGLLLLIASLNVSNLLLARGVRRRSEFALRAALGAGQVRLVRQVMVESLLLAVGGGVLGMLVAVAGVQALVALSPAGLPRVDSIGVNGATFAFSAGLTALVGIGFGLAPALHASHTSPLAGLQRGSSRTVAGPRRTLRLLVVAEVGLALMLLVGSGLLLRSFRRLVAVELGFQPTHLLTMQIQTTGHRFDARGVRPRFFDAALEAVRRLPEVAAAAMTSQLPLSGDIALYGVHFEPSPPGDPVVEEGGTLRYVVTPGYFSTMGIPVRRGRPLEDRDARDAPRVVVISASLARRRLPGLDPIGQRLRIGTEDLRTVVGVVSDVKALSLAREEPSAVYIPMAQAPWDEVAMSVVVRSRGAPGALAPSVRRAVWSVDRNQPIVRVATMQDLAAASAAERRFALVVFAVFALAALLLAAAGIYGVLAGIVAERTREIGIRAALGAPRLRILTLVLRQGMTMAVLGLVLGTAGAVAATRGLGALLFEVSPLDPLTYVAVSGLLSSVALLACAVPAWRAARVDPVRTLRAE